jgi:outer membrane protein assembly factor BamB
VDRGQVIAASHASRVVDIDLRSGARLWEQNFGSLNSPWVAGDFLFMVTTEADLICVSRRDGRVRWVTPLEKFKDRSAKTGRITWVGPILAGGRLLAINSEGQGVIVTPETGEILSRISLSASVSVLPIVANRTIYVLNDDATLIALR